MFFLFLSEDEQNILSGLNMSYFICTIVKIISTNSASNFIYIGFCFVVCFWFFFSFFMFVLGNLSLISPGSVLLLLLVLCGFTSYQTCIVVLFAGCYSCWQVWGLLEKNCFWTRQLHLHKKMPFNKLKGIKSLKYLGTQI